MPAILAIVERILAAVLNALGILEVVRGLVERLAQEHTPYTVENAVLNLQSGLRNPSTGAVDTRALIVTLTDGSTHTLQDVLDAITGIPAFELPSPPPTGYGGATAQQVWEDYSLPTTAEDGTQYQAPYLAMLSLVAHAVLSGAQMGYTDSRNQDFALVSYDLTHWAGDLRGWGGVGAVDPPDAIDWSTWDGSESLLTFLNRVESKYTWLASDPDEGSIDGRPWAQAGSHSYNRWRCVWPEWMLPILSGRAFAAADYTDIYLYIDALQTAIELAITNSQTAITDAITATETAINAHTDTVQTAITDAITASEGTITGAITSSQGVITGALADALADILAAIGAIPPGSYAGPPTWPGLAGVTLGTPVALSDSVAIDEAMDGVIVAVTTPPSKVGVRVIGGMPYDYNAGELAFVTEQGDAEPWVYLGFRAAIFTPKTMQRAGGVRLRALHGAEGTITPWQLTA